MMCSWERPGWGGQGGGVEGVCCPEEKKRRLDCAAKERDSRRRGIIKWAAERGCCATCGWIKRERVEIGEL
jgi:hypothetical protein